MRWTPGGQSEDIEDRRSSGGGVGFGGFGGRGLGLGGTLILLVLSVVFHRNLFTLFDSTSSGQSSGTSDRVRDDAERPDVQFVSFVLDDAQQTWDKILPGYRHAKLVLFRDAVQSACGMEQSATGPFYCPADEKVYLDLGFFDELKERFG